MARNRKDALAVEGLEVLDRNAAENVNGGWWGEYQYYHYGMKVNQALYQSNQNGGMGGAALGSFGSLFGFGGWW